jgi:hypothetical protein
MYQLKKYAANARLLKDMVWSGLFVQIPDTSKGKKLEK